MLVLSIVAVRCTFSNTIPLPRELFLGGSPPCQSKTYTEARMGVQTLLRELTASAELQQCRYRQIACFWCF